MGAVVFNYFFTEPRFTFHMTEGDDIANLIDFLIIAVFSSQVTIHFRSQREELHKEQLKSNLLLSVPHDLRTPLATIIDTLSTLQTYASRLSDSEKDELLSGALEESHRLHRYVENLLQTTKIPHGKSDSIPGPRTSVASFGMRNKLSDNPESPEFIRTEPGIGYCFMPSPELTTSSDTTGE